MTTPSRTVARLCLAAALAALHGVACGTSSKNNDDCCVQWVLMLESDVRSGAEIRLDGQSVYHQSTATVLTHRVDLVRDADTQDHVVEFSILAEEPEPGTFTSTVTVQSRPGGDFKFLKGQPISLRVGDRLTVVVHQ